MAKSATTNSGLTNGTIRLSRSTGGDYTMRSVPLTFVVGRAADVFGPVLADAVDSTLRARFPSLALGPGERWESDPVEFAGWRELARRTPMLSALEPYQAGLIPADAAAGRGAPPDPERRRPAAGGQPLAFARRPARIRRFRALPTDDVELMELGAKY